MRKIIAVTIGILLVIGLLEGYKRSSKPNVDNMRTIRFMPIGDSYTIGEGVAEEESWPRQLEDSLKRDGVAIELVANPSVTGYTTEDALTLELPQFESVKPDFATVLIGANDIGRGVTPELYQSQLRQLLDRMQEVTTNKKHIILLTIPDFTASPVGKQYGGTAASQILSQFNDIIREEGEARGLPVVDLFPISKQMETNFDLVSPDGLHPSGAEYQLWVELIAPVAKQLLTSK
jgi:acyl-CoA thioesterase-1